MTLLYLCHMGKALVTFGFLRVGRSYKKRVSVEDSARVRK